jgi:NADH-quinone oxidoreductase subunit A
MKKAFDIAQNYILAHYTISISKLVYFASFLNSILSNKNQIPKDRLPVISFNLWPFFCLSYGTELKFYTPSGQRNESQQQQLKILGYEFPFSLEDCITHLEKMLDVFHYQHNLNSYLGQYFKIFVFFTIIFILSLLLFVIAYFLSLNTMRDAEKLSQYECGFEPFDEATRHPFDVHFYVVGILFLIFDVEIALLFPWVFSLTCNKWLNFYTMLLFLFILTIGFFYEWHRGALVWPHKQ